MSRHGNNPTAHTSRNSSTHRKPLRTATAAIASLAMVMAMAVVGIFGGGVASAGPTLPTGISSTSVLLNGTTYDGKAVVEDGDTLTLKVQYNTSAVGKTIKFETSDNLTGMKVADPDANGVPDGNKAIDSVSTSGSTVSITFKNPWPTGVPGGVFSMQFKVDYSGDSAIKDLKWKVGTEEQSVQVIIKGAGDEFADVSDGYDKNVNYTASDLNQYVSVDASGKVTVDPNIKTKEIEYTLVLNSEQKRENYTIADQLPAGMAYVTSGSKLDVTSAKLTTWDSNGLNLETENITFDPTITISTDYDNGGDSFSGTVSVPGTTNSHGARNPDGPSTLIIKYKAIITDVTALENSLQSAYNAKKGSLNGVEGHFSAILKNTAKFGSSPDATRHATVKVTGQVDGITPGAAFKKDSNWSTVYVVEDAGGALNHNPVVSYKLTAKLGSLEGSSGSSPINQNVVIADTLPAAAKWATTESSFITVSGTKGSTTFNFSSESCPAGTIDADAMASDTYKGNYCVDGQTLYVNVGQDTTTSVDIRAKASIQSLAGLAKRTLTSKYTKIEDATAYLVVNTATFYYKTDGSSSTAKKKGTVVALPTSGSSEGLDDADVFTKAAPGGEIHIDKGQAGVVTYDFTIHTGKGVNPATGESQKVDPTKSYIIDYVDTSVFDLSDLSAIKISGKYGSTTLKNDGSTTDYDLSVVGGNLKIELSSTGESKLSSLPSAEKWTLAVSLPTRVFTEKQTLAVTNSATLFGSSANPLYHSSVNATTTSYGNEPEVQKYVYDAANGAWVDELAVPVAQLTGGTVFYRIDYIPHGTFDNVGINAVTDALPTQLDFCAFVNESDVGTDPTCSSPGSPQTMGGNLQASYSSETVTIANKSGTKLNAGGNTFSTFFATTVKDGADLSAPIVNTVMQDTTPLDEVTVTPKDPTPPVPDEGIAPAQPTVNTAQCTADDAGSTVWETVTVPEDTEQVTYSSVSVDGDHVATVVATPGDGYTFDDIELGEAWSVSVDGDSATWTHQLESEECDDNPPEPDQPGIVVPQDPQCTTMSEPGFEPGETVTITITDENGQHQQTATADEDGVVRFCFDRSTPGDSTIEVLGEHHTVVRQITVKGEELSYTGMNLARDLGLALLLLAGGAALLLTGRRRRNANGHL